MKGILGRKIGMTQVFTKSGKLIPVTVISIEPNIVTQIKTKENDGYEAIQVGFGNLRDKLATKASMGITNKAGTTPKRFFREFRGVNINDYTVGKEIKADIFTEGEMVDVTGVTKGKGFEGVIKRHNQSRGPMGHGSQYHRSPGSMGTMRPMRVLKGKNLPGHMGCETVTIQNLSIVSIDLENNCILVKGNVPGAKNALVMIRTAVKNADKVNNMEELICYDVTEEAESKDEKVEEKAEAETETVETAEAETAEN